MTEDNGRWVTVRGTRVFIRDGETPTEAINRSIRANSESPETKDISAADMPSRLKAAKATVDPKDAWRVDDTYTAADYSHCKRFSVGTASCVAVKQGGEDDGDIVSVCKSKADTGKVGGRQLLELAVKNGGTKLDSFEGNHGFYVKCGFEPVSWCKFDKDYAPHDWDAGRDKQEPVIFYKYTGKVSTETADAFRARIPASADYDAAKAARNADMKKRR